MGELIYVHITKGKREVIFISFTYINYTVMIKFVLSFFINYTVMIKFVLSFFSDRLIVYLFKDVKDSVKGANPKSHFPLDGFYGLESGICFDKETSVLAIICQKVITLLAFESRETLIQFEIKIRRSLGEGNFIFVALKKWLIRKFQFDCLMIN